MNKKFNGALGLVLLVAVIGAVELIISSLPFRADLTAEKLYTLSKGSRAVLGKLEEDVTLKFYFSSSSADMPMGLKTYAGQVQDLLKEYERAGKGHVVLEAYDPKPDSDAEEWAQRYGVEPQNANPFGQPVYFGLVAVCGDREETLSRFSPRTESTLEYDVTRCITRVAWPERPVIGVMTSLQGVLGEEQNPMMMMQQRQRPNPGWAAFSELKKDYDVRSVATDVEKIDDDIKTLVVLHAKDLSEKALFAIDQFVIRGGRLIACVDPFSVMDLISSRQQQNPMMMQMGGNGPSTLGKLFEAWGVSFDTAKVVADGAAATRLGGNNGQAELNPAFLSLGKDNMEKKSLLVAQLSQVMFPFAGSLSFGKTEGLEFEPLIVSSKDNACMVESMGLQFGGPIRVNPDNVQRTLAARLSGTFKTAFPKGPDYKEGSTNAVPKVVASGKGTVLLFADSDFLADQFCVQTINTIFGTMAQPMNDNLSLFSNAIEQFAGREELIGVRSRGPSNRPFTKVDALEAKALAKFQHKQSELEAALQETQQRLSALQKQKSGNDRLLLSKEQQDEILQFRKTQANTRRQLKNVRKELTADIDSLGLTLKVVNIMLVPLCVIAFGIFHGIRRRRH
ncbi:MAG: Gldg family protein [Kiritimatiellae bacterium]|nr:Gldg family protein [Kiritimatiellia bacterium]